MRLMGVETTQALLHLRLRSFQHEVQRLLERHLHLALLLLGLLGLPLVYNPEILGLPLLDLTRPSVSWQVRLGGLWSFFGVLLAWVTLMRSAARGGELARYLRSMPLDLRSLEWVERAMAAVAAGIAWIPLLVAVWKVGSFADEGSSPAVTLLVISAMALVTWALSRALLADQGLLYRVLLIAVSSTLVTVEAGQLLSWRTLPPVIATALTALYVFSRPGGAGASPIALSTGLSGLQGRTLIAHSVQLKTLFVQYLASTLARLLLGSVFAWAAAWQTVNNLQPEAGLLVRHILLGMCLFVMASLHSSLLDARQPYLRYLRAFPLALRTLRRADHRLVGGLSLLVMLTGLWFGGGAAGRAHPLNELLESGYYAVFTSVVGSQWVLMRGDGTLWPVGVASVCTLCGFWIFT